MNIIIQIYAPATDYDDVEIEEMYERIVEIIVTIPRKDLLITQGDWKQK